MGKSGRITKLYPFTHWKKTMTVFSFCHTGSQSQRELTYPVSTRHVALATQIKGPKQ